MVYGVGYNPPKSLRLCLGPKLLGGNCGLPILLLLFFQHRFKHLIRIFHILVHSPVSFWAMTVFAITFTSCAPNTFLAKSNSTSPICLIRKPILLGAGNNLLLRSSSVRFDNWLENRVRASSHNSMNSCVFDFIQSNFKIFI